MCCAGRSAPSQCEMVTGPGCSSPNRLDKERTTAYRASAGPDSWADAHCATIVANWEEPSGESRLKTSSNGIHARVSQDKVFHVQDDLFQCCLLFDQDVMFG